MPVKPVLSDSEFVRIYEDPNGGPTEAARRAGLAGRGTNWTVKLRRVEQALGRPLVPPNKCGRHANRVSSIFPERVEYELKNGIALIISDLHIWPGPRPLMQRAFVKFCKDLEPAIVILNGDVVDMAAVSRHPPINWEKLPTVQEEIEAAQDYLHQIEMAVGPGVPTVWTLGNHCARFETRLATVAPEYAKLKGVHLKDHFGVRWENAWSCWINDDVQVKHRFKGGMHSPQNNVLWSGMSMVAGHQHSAKVYPISTDKTRYGVDTGTGADTFGPQFIYMEDNPRNWRSAFGVLTFRDGKLMFPELVTAWSETQVQFRGDVISV